MGARWAGAAGWCCARAGWAVATAPTNHKKNSWRTKNKIANRQQKQKERPAIGDDLKITKNRRAAIDHCCLHYLHHQAASQEVVIIKKHGDVVSSRMIVKPASCTSEQLTLVSIVTITTA